MTPTKRAKPVRKTKRGTERRPAVSIEAGSGNVFADLGFPDADLRLAKAQRARAIKHVIVARDWTQAVAARAAQLAPSDMSDICRGKLAKFSLERLDSTLLNLGVNIEVRLQAQPVAAGRGTLRVVECAGP